MNLFKNTTQILSELAIKDSSISCPKSTRESILEQVQTLVESYPSVNTEEMKFYAEMVPVKKSNRLGVYLVEMEDISRYMMTNNITSIQEAISNIKAVNKIDEYSNFGLVLDEQALLEEIDAVGAAGAADGKVPVNVNGNFVTGLLGDASMTQKFRKFANSKEFLDKLEGIYGLKLFKKNYEVGLSHMHEDAADITPTPSNNNNTSTNSTSTNTNSNKPTQSTNNPSTNTNNSNTSTSNSSNNNPSSNNNNTNTSTSNPSTNNNTNNNSSSSVKEESGLTDREKYLIHLRQLAGLE